MKKIKTYYRRRLPHFQPIGATFFVTFRLFNSIPYAHVEPIKRAYQKQKEKILTDKFLDKKNRLAKAKQQYFTQYDTLLDFVPLDRIMKRIKGPTAIYANRILNRKGQF